MHPDIIIVLDDNGQVESVVSNHHLTYEIVPRSTLKADRQVADLLLPKQADFVGTYRQMLMHLGVTPPPRKEFDCETVIRLAKENKFLANVLARFGFELNAAVQALASTPDRLNEPLVKALRALYNSFIATDPKLMGRYIEIQTR